MRRSRVWWLIATFFLIIAGGGAAAGTILANSSSGHVLVKVSRPLYLQKPWVNVPSPRDVFVSTGEDGQSFRAIVEAGAGEYFLLHLPVVNQATANIDTLLTLSYPDGVSVVARGSGVINDVVPVTYRSWKFTADAGAQGLAATPYDGIQLSVSIPAWFTGVSIEISGTIQSTSGLGRPGMMLLPTVTPEPLTLGTLYLHNSPTPPVADTNSQASLPMDTYVPTAGMLYNYDKDRDSEPGRLIMPGGSAGENDLSKYQNWQLPITENLSLSGDARLIFWSAIKDFDPVKRGIVTVYLRDLHNGTYTEIASRTLDISPWQQGSAGWVEREIIIPAINYTIFAGHTLEAKVVVEAGSSDMWFAYDTTAYPSRLILPTSQEPVPAAAFSAMPTSGEPPLTVAFTDSSTSAEGIVSWSWSFGDGGTSTQQNPTHIYTAAGSYDVSLTVAEADGDSDVETKTAFITVSEQELKADFSASVTSGVEPLMVTFTDQSISMDGIISWAWTFGDGAISALTNPWHTYSSEGVYDVSLTVTDIDGDTDTITKAAFISVADADPNADLAAIPTSGEEPLVVAFHNLSTSYDGLTSWLWDFGDGETSAEYNPTHIYQLRGTYEVLLTITEADGDMDTKTASIAVNSSATKLYVVDMGDKLVYQYSSTGTFLGVSALNNQNADAKGISTDNSSFWTVDNRSNQSDRIFKYTSDFTYQAVWSLNADNADAEGVTVDGSYIWVVDSADAKVYKYTTSGGFTGTSWSLNAENTDPTGITTGGTYVWVVDHSGKKVYQYTMNGGFLSSWDLRPSSGNPQGITTNGVYIWVLERTSEEVEQYTVDGTFVLQWPLLANNNNAYDIAVLPR